MTRFCPGQAKIAHPVTPWSVELVLDPMYGGQIFGKGRVGGGVGPEGTAVGVGEGRAVGTSVGTSGKAVG